MYVCIFIYIYTYTHTYLSFSLSLFIYIYIYAYISLSISLSLYIYIYIYAYTYTTVGIYARAWVVMARHVMLEALMCNMFTYYCYYYYYSSSSSSSSYSAAPCVLTHACIHARMRAYMRLTGRARHHSVAVILYRRRRWDKKTLGEFVILRFSLVFYCFLFYVICDF